MNQYNNSMTVRALVTKGWVFGQPEPGYPRYGRKGTTVTLSLLVAQDLQRQGHVQIKALSEPVEADPPPSASELKNAERDMKAKEALATSHRDEQQRLSKRMEELKRKRDDHRGDPADVQKIVREYAECDRAEEALRRRSHQANRDWTTARDKWRRLNEAFAIHEAREKLNSRLVPAARRFLKHNIRTVKQIADSVSAASLNDRDPATASLVDPLAMISEVVARAVGGEIGLGSFQPLKDESESDIEIPPEVRTDRKGNVWDGNRIRSMEL